MIRSHSLQWVAKQLLEAVNAWTYQFYVLQGLTLVIDGILFDNH